MISVIICSRTATLRQPLADNIAATIGVPYELVVIDNSANQYGICQAYNIGVQKSQYHMLCFMHDDLEYQSANWGQNVAQHFKDNDVAAIGVAGTPYLAFMPGPWWGSGHTYQHLAATTKEELLLQSPAKQLKEQVVLLDGCWTCIKKEAFNKIRFDETAFTGYHFYDADICMQLNQSGYQIYTISDILINHASMGNANSSWIENALMFHKKWKLNLPVSSLSTNNKPIFTYEYKTLNAFIWACYYNNYSNKFIYRLALKSQLSFKKGISYYKSPAYFLKFLFKYLFKKGKPFYSFL